MLERIGFAMAVQFRREGDRWLYRRDQIGPALPTSEAERDRHVRRYAWLTLAAAPLLLAGVALYALVADALLPNPTTNQSVAATVIGMVVVFTFIYLYLRWCSHAPARAFADRVPVAPARTRRETFRAYRQRFSYTGLIAGLSIFIAAGVWALRETPEVWWLPFVLFLPIGIGLVWWKRRIETS